MKIIKSECLVDLQGNPLIIRVNEHLHQRLLRERAAAYSAGQTLREELLQHEIELPQKLVP